ncbi:MAG: hypothetical protein WDW36_002554 [Sanguina aurantia]
MGGPCGFDVATGLYAGLGLLTCADGLAVQILRVKAGLKRLESLPLLRRPTPGEDAQRYAANQQGGVPVHFGHASRRAPPGSTHRPAKRQRRQSGGLLSQITGGDDVIDDSEATAGTDTNTVSDSSGGGSDDNQDSANVSKHARRQRVSDAIAVLAAGGAIVAVPQPGVPARAAKSKKQRLAESQMMINAERAQAARERKQAEDARRRAAAEEREQRERSARVEAYHKKMVTYELQKTMDMLAMEARQNAAEQIMRSLQLAPAVNSDVAMQPSVFHQGYVPSIQPVVPTFRRRKGGRGRREGNQHSSDSEGGDKPGNRPLRLTAPGERAPSDGGNDTDGTTAIDKIRAKVKSRAARKRALATAKRKGLRAQDSDDEEEEEDEETEQPEDGGDGEEEDGVSAAPQRVVLSRSVWRIDDDRRMLRAYVELRLRYASMVFDTRAKTPCLQVLDTRAKTPGLAHVMMKHLTDSTAGQGCMLQPPQPIVGSRHVRT